MTGGNHTLLAVDYWTFGLLAPGVGFAVSFLGAFLAMRCAGRADACRGLTRATWLVLGGIAVGALGTWAMDFIALLGFTIPGETIRYNVPLTLLSLGVAVAIMCAGLLVAGYSRGHSGWLLASGLVAGIGLAVMHYLGMAAMRMPAQVTYEPAPLIGSVVLAIGAATAALWAAARLRALWHAILAALVVAAGVSGMHYLAMAAVRLYQPAGPARVALPASTGVTAAAFLLPLIIGITIVVFLTGSVIALSPTADAIRYDETLLDDIRRRSREPLEMTPLIKTPGKAGSNGAARSSPPWTFAELRRPAAGPAAAGRSGQRRS